MADLAFLDTRQMARLARKTITRQAAEFVFHKAHTGVKPMPYEEFVREAVCFGWIDCLVKRLGDDRFAIKVTPSRAMMATSSVSSSGHRLERLQTRTHPALERVLTVARSWFFRTRRIATMVFQFRVVARPR